MLTRGLLIKEFKRKLTLWLNGPSKIIKGIEDWPKYELQCLAEERKEQINNIIVLVYPITFSIQIYKKKTWDNSLRLILYFFNLD